MNTNCEKNWHDLGYRLLITHFQIYIYKWDLFNSIKFILQNYIKEYEAGTDKIEIPASSSYFIGRIGGYPKALMLLSTINFQLESKPYAGLCFSIHSTRKTYEKASSYLNFLKDFISVLKECRINEQFLPDYDLS